MLRDAGGGELSFRGAYAVGKLASICLYSAYHMLVRGMTLLGAIGFGGGAVAVALAVADAGGLAGGVSARRGQARPVNHRGLADALGF